MLKLVKLLQSINKVCHVACSENTFICLTSVQWPGGKALNAQQIAQTQKLHVGQILP